MYGWVPEGPEGDSRRLDCFGCQQLTPSDRAISWIFRVGGSPPTMEGPVGNYSLSIQVSSSRWSHADPVLAGVAVCGCFRR